MRGIDWDLDAQAGWVRAMTEPYVSEVEGLAGFREATRAGFGPGYGPIESLLLHCVLRSLRPARVLEIGSGVSSVVTEEALRMNRTEGRDGRLTCVEPYPRKRLREIPGLDLHEVSAQRAPVALFDALEAGDVLFIDSTHTVKTGSELARIYLEIVPRLSAGVVIHVHDVFLPFTYAPDIMTNLFDWQESTLLAALLCGNRRLRVLGCLSALHEERSARLREMFLDYQPALTTAGLFGGSVPDGHFPSSIWIEVKSDDE
jgi:predicted O-methyltransferase YrrM